MKQAYSLFREGRFLIAFSRRCTRGILIYTLLTAVWDVCRSLCVVLLFPLLIRYIGNGSHSAYLAAAALLMSGWWIFHTLHAYCDKTLSRLRDALRTRGNTQLVHLSMTSPYSQAVNPDHIAALRRASDAMGRHINAPIPRFFQTVSEGLSHGILATVLILPLCLRFPVTTAVTVTTALIGAWVHRAVTVQGYRYHEQESTHDAVLASLSPIAQRTAYAKDIRMFGLVSWLQSVRDSSMSALRTLIRRRAAVFFLFNVTDTLLAVLRNGIAYSVLIHEAVTNGLPAWTCVFFLLCVTGLTHAVSGLLTSSADLRQELEAVSHYRCYMEQHAVGPDTGKRPVRGVPHTLSLNNVVVRCADTVKPLLNNVSLTLRSGEKLAVVGTDHRAKLALAKLLCGLIDPDEGSVLLDGTDMRDYDRQRCYELFSTVLQSGILPGMTVAENVALSFETADETRVWDCLKKADAAKAVSALPNGIYTPLSDTALSGGQLQRLLLARALFKDGDMFLLDEPTSALDPLAEEALYREYRRLTEGKSVVFISQRLASTRFCDRIIVIKNGRIAEEGAHGELMAKGGEYARLFELQSRYYREGRNPDASF